MATDNEKSRAELLAELAELRLYRDLTNQSGNILLIIDPLTSQIIDGNQRMSELLGYSRSELMTMSISDFDEIYSDQAALESLFEELRFKGAKDFESVLKRKDGTTLPVEINVKHAVDNHKEFLVVSVRDITVHKSAQEELKSERAFIEAALNASPDTFFVFDVTSGKPVRWNLMFQEVSGYSHAEIEGMKAPDDFYDAEDLKIAHGALSKVADSGYARVDLPLLTKDGKKIPYEYAVTMIDFPDGASSLACSVGRDITDRQQAEEALRHSEATHRSFLDSLSAGVVAHAPDTSTLYWNRMSLQLLGLSEDQILGRTAFDPAWNFLNEDGSVMAPEDYPVNLTLKNETNLSGYIVGVVRPVSNDVIWALCNSHRILADSGELEHVLVSFLDITDLKKAEEERRSLQAQVQHSQKLESLGILAGGIAHDFNNLLMTILGNTDLTLRDLPPVSPVRPNIQEVDSAARRAAELAKQMLAYSGQGHFVVAPLDLSEMVKEMAHLLESSTSKKVILKTDLAQGLPAINADAAQIQQVILNLITNASEAIPEDKPGVISVSTNVQECSREYLAGSYLDEKQSPGKYAFLEVKDTGSGMDIKTRDSLFDPFFTTKFTGRGLGLAAVLGIVRGHNGAIMVDSEPGRGTTFRVLFPALGKDVKVHASQGIRTKRDDWRGTGTVLVVDDESSVRRLVITMTERLGFKTLAATDGQEAVEVFREHADSITCVLLDLTMPRMDGGETCLEIQRVRRDVPIILSSGYEETVLSERFDEYDMAGFLQKPYKLAKLKDVLQRVHAVEP